MNENTKKLSNLGMLSALAIISVLLVRIPLMPAAPFLTYDPKDVIIVIAGFIYGPLAAFMMAVVVAFVEMITVSETGIIGLIMNVVASSAFACTAAFIYKRKRTLNGAVAGLMTAWIFTTVVMVLWNYLITPLFMEVPRHVVVGMLLPVFVPFNLLKGGLNAGFAMLLYKPFKSAASAANLMNISTESSEQNKANIGVILGSLCVILICILIVGALILRHNS